MRKLTALFLLPSIFLLSSCAGMIEMACQRDNAYASGMNDARDGKPMATYNGVCPAHLQQEAASGYREGYRDGLDSRRKALGDINIHIGNG